MALDYQKLHGLARGGERKLGSGVPTSRLALPLLSYVTLHELLRTSTYLSEGLNAYLTVLF